MPNPNINRRTLRGPVGGYDPDLLDWVSRVQGQGSDVSVGTKDAVNTFILAIKAAGLRTAGSTKLKRVGVYAGNDILALNAPLYNEWGSVTDSLVNFVGGDYAETGASGGLTGNTTTKYINPDIDLNVLVGATQSYHASVYLRATTGGNVIPVGCQNPGFGRTSYMYANLSGTSYWACWTAGDQIAASDSNGTGLYIGSRTDATHNNLYRNGSSIGSSSVDNSGNSPPGNVLPGNIAKVTIHAFQNGTFPPILNNPNPISFYSLGVGLSSSESSDLYNAVQALQTALTRNV